MKKLIALLLAVVMVFALAACGGSNEAPAAEEPAAEAPAAPAAEPDAAVPEAPAAEPEAPAAEPAGDASGEMGASGEPSGEIAAPVEAGFPAGYTYTGENVSILFSTTFQETATGGEIVTYFKNTLEDATNGAISVQITYGGTLFGDADQLDGVAQGAVNMIALGHNPHADVIPLLCGVPDFAPDSVQNALDYFNYLLFDNPESSAVLTAEAEAIGVKYLNVIPGGANAFVSSKPFTGLSDLINVSAAFGNMEAAKFSALGFTVEAVLPWDLYQSFSTGLIDASQMASTSMLQDGVAEVAPYWMYDNTYTAGNFFTVNLAWWNGLSAEAQEAIQYAANATEAFAAQYYIDALASEAATLEGMGVTLVDLSDADFDLWWSTIMESKAADTIAAAATNGNVAEAQTVLQAAADFTGYDLTF